MKYPAGTLMQWTPKALKKYGSKISANEILVVVDHNSMYSGDIKTGHLTILNFYKTQDCHVKLYSGPAVTLWTTETDISFEFTKSNEAECREFCKSHNIEIK